MIKAFSKIAFLCVFLPYVSAAQDNTAELELKKAGYLLSVSSNRLEVIRTDLSKIRKKNMVLNELDNPQMFYIALLMENIFMAETICAYEGLLLKTFDNFEDNKKLEQYNFHYSRLKESTLNRLYLINRSTQANISNINNKEIRLLADVAKEEMLKVQKEIEGVMNILQNQNKSTP
jgi:hypothetical protein